jgi:DNA-binding CsgD family transcriptional regulator
MRRKENSRKANDECAIASALEREKSNVAMEKPAPMLTAAEKRVLALVSSAKTNKEIANTLGVSPATVKRHLENVLRKLDLRNRVEAAIYGLIANGCPHGSHSGCPLELWRKARDGAESKWAI